MNFVNNKGIGNLAGTIKLSESKYGVVFSPQLKGLTPGFHGFHIHQHASCMPKTKAGKSVPALAAGGHYDPGLSKSMVPHGAMDIWVIYPLVCRC